MKNGITIQKKNPVYDIERYQSLFFSIGLTLSLLLVIVMFEWKTIDQINTLDLNNDATQFEEVLDIPLTQVEPPPPPEKSFKTVEIVEVSDVEEIKEEITLELDIEMTEETKVAEYIPEMENLELEEPEDEKVDEIFTIVEEQPVPIGGYEAYYEFIYAEIKYPSSALRYRIQGRVFIQFVVESDGNLSDFRIIRGIGADCDEEAIRVLKMAPKWKPGKQRGRPVRVQMILPVTFRLIENSS